jgi:hypothetical protein
MPHCGAAHGTCALRSEPLGDAGPAKDVRTLKLHKLCQGFLAYGARIFTCTYENPVGALLARMQQGSVRVQLAHFPGSCLVGHVIVASCGFV